MAHFARIENNIVTEVVVVSNDALDPDNEEASGLQLLADSGLTGDYIQCSYNGSFRGCYPGPGYEWRPDKRRKDGGEFIGPPPPSPISTPA